MSAGPAATAVAADLADRLDRRLFDLAGLLGGDLYEMFRRRCAPRAEVLAAQLTGDDARLAAQTAIDLADLVDLTDVADAATPVGIAVALTFEHELISQAAAAQLLGVSRSRVQQLLARGHLVAVGEDPPMVGRASVARRLLGQQAPDGGGVG